MTAPHRQQLKREISRFLKANPKIEQFEVLATDICGHYFGKRYPIDKLKTFAEEGLAMPASMFVLNSIGEPLEGLYYGVEDGDPDGHFYLVPGSLCRYDWGSRPRAQVLATTCGGEQPSWLEPRQVLQRAVDAYARRKWRPMVPLVLAQSSSDFQRIAEPFSGQ